MILLAIYLAGAIPVFALALWLVRDSDGAVESAAITAFAWPAFAAVILFELVRAGVQHLIDRVRKP